MCRGVRAFGPAPAPERIGVPPQLWQEQAITVKPPASEQIAGRLRLHRRGFHPVLRRARELHRAVSSEGLRESALCGELSSEAFDLDLRNTIPSAPDLSHQGRVHRHFCRGGPVYDPRAERVLQDDRCKAGLRNPAALQDCWPELWGVMAPINDLLMQARRDHPELRALRRAFGADPEIQPPAPELLRTIRAQVCQLVGLPAGAGEEHHQASPWRHRLVGRIQQLSGDPDEHLEGWLRDGAPMGLRKPSFRASSSRRRRRKPRFCLRRCSPTGAWETIRLSWQQGQTAGQEVSRPSRITLIPALACSLGRWKMPSSTRIRP